MEAGPSRPNTETRAAQNACEICGAGFPTEGALRSHQNMAHHRSSSPGDPKLEAYLAEREKDREAGIGETPESSREHARPEQRMKSDRPSAPGSAPIDSADEETGAVPAEPEPSKDAPDDRGAGSDLSRAESQDSEPLESPPPNRRADRKDAANSEVQSA